MPRRVLIDSGPCVALFDKDDKHHRQATDFTRGFRGELVTSRFAVTEVMYVLDFNHAAQMDFLIWIDEGNLTLVEVDEYDRVRQLMVKYRDLPMDFTDGVLVALCEELEVKTIATFDTDFTVYRFKGRGKFDNVFE